MAVILDMRAAEFEPHPVGDGRAEVGKGCAAPDRARPQARTKRKQRNVFAGVVGGRRGRIVAVVSGDEKQIVLVEGGGDGRKGVIELP